MALPDIALLCDSEEDRLEVPHTDGVRVDERERVTVAQLDVVRLLVTD